MILIIFIYLSILFEFFENSLNKKTLDVPEHLELARTPALRSTHRQIYLVRHWLRTVQYNTSYPSSKILGILLTSLNLPKKQESISWNFWYQQSQENHRKIHHVRLFCLYFLLFWLNISVLSELRHHFQPSGVFQSLALTRYCKSNKLQRYQLRQVSE